MRAYWGTHLLRHAPTAARVYYDTRLLRYAAPIAVRAYCGTCLLLRHALTATRAYYDTRQPVILTQEKLSPQQSVLFTQEKISPQQPVLLTQNEQDNPDKGEEANKVLGQFDEESGDENEEEFPVAGTPQIAPFSEAQPR